VPVCAMQINFSILFYIFEVQEADNNNKMDVEEVEIMRDLNLAILFCGEFR
jgi:hypothetical protein